MAPGQEAEQADLLRELFGNPFRKVRRIGAPLHARIAAWPDNRQPDDILFVREWLSWGDAAITDLSCAVFEYGAFDHMPILADALEEAGCDDEAILEHCRTPFGPFAGLLGRGPDFGARMISGLPFRLIEGP